MTKLLILMAFCFSALSQTNLMPKVGETWFFDDRNPWHRTYYEGTVLAVSNGWVLVKDSLGKTNSWSVGAMGTFHKKMPPVPIASRLSLEPLTNYQWTATNYTLTNVTTIVLHPTNIHQFYILNLTNGTFTTNWMYELKP